MTEEGSRNQLSDRSIVSLGRLALTIIAAGVLVLTVAPFGNWFHQRRLPPEPLPKERSPSKNGTQEVVASSSSWPAARVHVYGNPAVSLERVHVKAVYFVPQDPNYSLPFGLSDLQARAVDFSEARNYLDQLIPQIERFHSQQFAGLSRIAFDVYPRVVVGLHKRADYLANDPGSLLGTSDPLKAIRTEVLSRVFSPTGDLYEATFAHASFGEYRILLILYVNSVLVLENRIPGFTGDVAEPDLTAVLVFTPVVDPLNKNIFWGRVAASVIYHELMHAMGVPEMDDEFASQGSSSTAKNRDDIMGTGVSGPLLDTYIGKDIMDRMKSRCLN